MDERAGVYVVIAGEDGDEVEKGHYFQDLEMRERSCILLECVESF